MRDAWSSNHELGPIEHPNVYATTGFDEGDFLRHHYKTICPYERRQDTGTLYLYPTPPRRDVIAVSLLPDPGSHKMPPTTVVHVLVEESAY